jgi:hypothetical protein
LADVQLISNKVFAFDKTWLQSNSSGAFKFPFFAENFRNLSTLPSTYIYFIENHIFHRKSYISSKIKIYFCRKLPKTFAIAVYIYFIEMWFQSGEKSCRRDFSRKKSKVKGLFGMTGRNPLIVSITFSIGPFGRGWPDEARVRVTRLGEFSPLG